MLAARDPPEMLLVEFDASAITYRIRVWTDRLRRRQARPRPGQRVAHVLRVPGAGHRDPVPDAEVIRNDRRTPREPAVGAELRCASASAEIFIEPARGTAARRSRRLASRPVRRGRIDRPARRSGQLDVRGALWRGRSADRARRQRSARIAAGGFFGEMSLLTGAPRNATVRTTVDSDVVEITADEFKEFVLANPAAVEQMGAAVAQRQAELDQAKATALRRLHPSRHSAWSTASAASSESSRPDNGACYRRYPR